MQRLKILLLGHCSYFTIANFTELLRQNIEGTEITVADPFNPGGDLLSEKQLKVFDKVIHIPSKKEVKIKFKDRVRSAFNIIRNRTGLRDFVFNFAALRIRKIKYTIDSVAESEIHGRLLGELFKNYDIYHFHYATPGFLYPIKYVPRDKIKMISVWGSDLFQTAGVKNYSEQISAFEAADFIIINTIEKREIFLSKFGRKYAGKIRLANFGLPECKFVRMENFYKSGNSKNFKLKNGIDEDKIVITIGYNASSKQNHSAIIKAMSRINPEVKSKLHLIIPLTYGFNLDRNEYIKELSKLCSDGRLAYSIIDKYIPEEEYFGILYSSDIKVNLRETDSMNTAMLESVFAGNIVINGAWHPYGILRRLGVYCREVENIDELEKLIPEISENIFTEKSKASKNPELIRSYFSSLNTAAQWEKLFDEARNLIKSN